MNQILRCVFGKVYILFVRLHEILTDKMNIIFGWVKGNVSGLEWSSWSELTVNRIVDIFCNNLLDRTLALCTTCVSFEDNVTEMDGLNGGRHRSVDLINPTVHGHHLFARSVDW